MKLLFLLELWSDYVIGAGAERSLREFLEKVLVGPPFTEALFDTWWRVERFEGIDESFEEVEARLEVEQPYLLSHSALLRVQAWLTGLEKGVPARVGAD